MNVETSTWATKKGLAQMLKGGVIMDVVTPDQARIAEEAGAVAVMALERVPADIRAAGGVARMSDPARIEGIMPALESSHALAYATRLAAGMAPDKIIVVNLSGRGDKDVHTIAALEGIEV